jgi:hypothetical protein
MPSVVARDQPSGVGAQVTRRVALLEHGLARVRQATVRREAHLVRVRVRVRVRARARARARARVRSSVSRGYGRHRPAGKRTFSPVGMYCK